MKTKHAFGVATAALMFTNLPAHAANRGKIAFSQSKFGNEWWETQAKGADAEIKKLGYEPTVVSAQGEPVTQKDQVRTLITQHFSTVMLSPTTPQGLESSIATLKKTGIPLITVNSPLSDSLLRTNRVMLDKEAKDSSGLPAAHVHYKLHENDRRLVEWGRLRAREAAEAAGSPIDPASTGVCAVNGPGPGWHIMGTCRMGKTPQDSTTNKFNQTWDAPNLFIADASALTTGAAVNPTSTRQTVAVRCAEYIKRRHADITSQRKTSSNREAPAFSAR